MKTTLFALLVSLVLAGCDNGRGLDAKLSTEDEFSYKVSLEKAFADMSEEQRKAYNWAVENYELTKLLAKYPRITPRKVIKNEADNLLIPREKKISELKKYLEDNAEQLAEAETAIIDARKELAKIVIKTLKTQKGNSEVVYNGSRFNLSFSEWSLRLKAKQSLFTDAVDEECYKFTISYPVNAGTSVPLKGILDEPDSPEEMGAGLLGCGLAAGMIDKFGGKSELLHILNEEGVKDSAGNYVIPRATTLSEHEATIAELLKEIDFLQKKKSVLD